jgi:methylglutaconyl-CoA hydratase
MDLVTLEVRGPVAVLRLNRPEVKNALSPALMAVLGDRLDELEAEHDVRAVVLTGEGSVFCSGADLENLRALRDAPSEAIKADAARLSRLFHRLYTFPKPVVAAVEGAAIAGGAGLATACDLVVIGAGAKMGYTEVRLGFVAAVVSVILVRSVGEKHARELLLTGKLIEASHAHRIGLVNEIVMDGTAIDRAVQLALEIAQNAPTALSATKELLATLPGMGLEESMRYAVNLNAWVRTTDDLKEGVGAFFEKRNPNWKP